MLSTPSGWFSNFQHIPVGSRNTLADTRAKAHPHPATCGAVGRAPRPGHSRTARERARPRCSPSGPSRAPPGDAQARVLPPPSGRRNSDAQSLRGTQWVGQGHEGSSWRAGHLLSSQGVHRGLFETPAATGMSPGPHSNPLGRGPPTCTDSACGTRLVPVMCRGPVGGASVDRRQGLTHETDRERDARPLQRGFPMATAAWAPPLSRGGGLRGRSPRPAQWPPSLPTGPAPLHPEPPQQRSTSACHTPDLLTALHCSGRPPPWPPAGQPMGPAQAEPLSLTAIPC